MKLVICDVDGTDYPATMWQPLVRSLGDAVIDEKKDTYKKWEKNDCKNCSEWVEDSSSSQKELRDDIEAEIKKRLDCYLEEEGNHGD
jgi:hypothetical protein